VSSVPVSLGDLVNRFLADFGGVAPGDALYIVHIGGEDLQDALAAFPTTVRPGQASDVIIEEALTAIGTNIALLAEAGARTFLVPNAPDLALVPAVRLQGPVAQAVARGLAESFNDLLETLLTGLEQSLGVKIYRLDTFALTDEVVAAPAAFGLTEVEVPCITPGTRTKPFCSHPNEFLFWDGLHPTVVGHGIITSRALEALAAP
jgi:phospholipase/lecithinase/hemolysin